MAKINQAGILLGSSWRSRLAIAQSNDCFCAISSEKLVAAKNQTKVPSCADLRSGDNVYFDAEPCEPFLTSIGNHVDIRITHRATKAWLPSSPASKEKNTGKMSKKKKNEKQESASGNNGELGQDYIPPLSMKMKEEACIFMRDVIMSSGGTLTFEDLSMRFSSFPLDVQSIIGQNVPAFKSFVKDHSGLFALTKSGDGVTLIVGAAQTSSGEEFHEADREARDYVHQFLTKAGGSMDIYNLLGDVVGFPKHIRDKTGRKFKGVRNFIKRHPGHFLLTGTVVTVTERAKSKVYKPNFARQQKLPAASDRQVPQDAIMWSWGKGTVIAVGSTFGYLQGFSQHEDLVVLFDSNSALFEEESTECDLSTRIQTGDLVRYVAYACLEGPDNRFTWKSLVVWKSNLSIDNCLLNSCLRVVQGQVTRVFQGGGSVTLGKSSDIRVPFSTSIVMSRSPVREANKMVSVGDRVACVLREATVEHLPCLVVECVWKTDLFYDPARDAPLKVPPVTSNKVHGSGTEVPPAASNQVYGSGKVLCVTPTGGLLQHGDLTISFESRVVYVNGKTACTSKLSKGATVFYYAVPPKDHEVTLKATLVWKGKKPKPPAPKDGPTLSTVSSSSALPRLEDQKRVNFLARDSDRFGSLNGETPAKVPGSGSLNVDDKGGILVPLDDSESSQCVVEYLHLQNGQESEHRVGKVGTSCELEKDARSTVKDGDSQETRHVDTQTISTGDIITLRLHTS